MWLNMGNMLSDGFFLGCGIQNWSVSAFTHFCESNLKSSSLSWPSRMDPAPSPPWQLVLQGEQLGPHCNAVHCSPHMRLLKHTHTHKKMMQGLNDTDTHPVIKYDHSQQSLQVLSPTLYYLVLKKVPIQPQGRLISGRPASLKCRYIADLPVWRGQIHHQSALPRPGPGKRGRRHSRAESRLLLGGWLLCLAG